MYFSKTFEKIVLNLIVFTRISAKFSKISTDIKQLNQFFWFFFRICKDNYNTEMVLVEFKSLWYIFKILQEIIIKNFNFKKILANCPILIRFTKCLLFFQNLWKNCRRFEFFGEFYIFSEMPFLNIFMNFQKLYSGSKFEWNFREFYLHLFKKIPNNSTKLINL